MTRFTIPRIQNVLKATTARLFGRVSSGTGRGEELTAAQVRSFLDVYTTSQVDGLISAIEGLTDADIDTLAELNAILSDADVASISYVDSTFVTASTLSESIDDRVNALLVAGTNITLTYNDVANTLEIASTASGGGNSFATITPQINGTAGTSVVADSSSDTLTINARIGCSVLGDAASDTLTINAWGCGSCPPAQISGAYRTAQMPSSSGQLALAANRLYKLPLVISERITIASCVIGVTALAAGSSIRIGLRRYDHTTGEFTTLPSGGDFGTVSSATTGTKTITGLNCTVDPGIYAIELVSDGTPTVSGTGSSAAQPSIWGAVWSSNFPFPIWGAYKSFTFGTLPTDETGVAQTAITSGAIPVVGLGV
jgi:hypothetical protein